MKRARDGALQNETATAQNDSSSGRTTQKETTTAEANSFDDAMGFRVDNLVSLPLASMHAILGHHGRGGDGHKGKRKYCRSKCAAAIQKLDVEASDVRDGRNAA